MVDEVVDIMSKTLSAQSNSVQPNSAQPNYEWHEGVDQQSLADNLAGELMIKVAESIDEKGSAVLSLSGGSTPRPLFKALASCDVDWSRVIITLVDERWVAETHTLSNAAFIKRCLLDALPDTVTFVPLYHKADSAEGSLDTVLNTYCQATTSSLDAPRACDVAVLGMGDDGHTASFFPDAENVADLVDPDTQAHLLSCVSSAAQVERVTWSLPMLLNASFLALHITGKNKKAVFEEACAANDTTQMPVRSVILQTRTPLNVYYAD